MATQSKKILTDEITAYLQNQIDECPDSEIGKCFGGKRYKSTDYFHQADSLRLRAAGYQLLRIFFDHEEFTMGRNFHAGEIIILARHMNSPFYINQEKIVLFSDEHIVMCKLAGDVTSWLKNFS